MKFYITGFIMASEQDGLYVEFLHVMVMVPVAAGGGL